MRELFEKLKKHLEQGEAAVLVTVIASSGSTPRGAGSRMLVDKDGLVCGTIGGGAVEYKAMGIAKEALEKKSSYTHGFTLTRNQVADIGMVCGGDVTVYFQYVDPEDRTFRAFLEQILEALSQDEDSWLLLDITDETCWKMGLYRRGEALGFVEASLKGKEECQTCPYAFICRGGCRRNRQVEESGELGKNYFCASYKRFFGAALPRMQEIAAALMRSGRR